MQCSSNQTITMESFRRSNNYNEDIHGQWRANAGEKVVYTEDFPAAILCATEFSDNSTGKGRATRIEIEFDITNPDAGIFRHTDNGLGIQRHSDLIRFLKFGSTESSDTFHHYAWGRFRAMTAFMPEYETGEWNADFKLQNNTSCLSRVCQPWSTVENMQKSIVDVPITDANRHIGLEMVIKFKTSIFGQEWSAKFNQTPQLLFDKMKERLTTKYGESVFETTEFVLTVKKGAFEMSESSRTHNWKTFESMLRESPSCQVVFDQTFQWKSIQVQVTEYNLSGDDPELSRLFPTFGKRCIPAQRVHIVNDDRSIEARKKFVMDKRDGHNAQNGEIVFIKTNSLVAGGSFADQPTPSTTKVSIKDDCPNLPGIYQMYITEKKRIEDEKAAEKKAKDKEAREKKKQETAEKKKQQAAISVASGGGTTAALPETDQEQPKATRTQRRTASPKQQQQPQQTSAAAVAASAATEAVSRIILNNEDMLAIRQMYMNSSGDVEQFMAQLRAQFSSGSSSEI